MDYEVRWIEEIVRDGEIQGGDDEFIKSFKTSKAAIRFGKKESFKTMRGKSKQHEIYIRCNDEENDTVKNWYIKNGVVKHHDKG